MSAYPDDSRLLFPRDGLAASVARLRRVWSVAMTVPGTKMRAPTRIAVIVVGYLLAGLLAWVTVAVHIAASDSPDRQATAGMSSFGDAFVFLCVFGLAALPPTAAALWALRSCRWFWVGLAGVACAVAVGALATVFAYVGWRADAADGPMQSLALLAPVRMLFAPPLTLLLAASAVFAPLRSARIALVLATLIEALAFIAFIGVLFASAR